MVGQGESTGKWTPPVVCPTHQEPHGQAIFCLPEREGVVTDSKEERRPSSDVPKAAAAARKTV